MRSPTASISAAQSLGPPSADPVPAAAGATLRLRTPLAAMGPMVVGIGVTVLARLLWDSPVFEAVRAYQSTSVAAPLVWVLPPAIGALVSCTRTLWLQIDPGGISARRMLGATRSYETSEVIGWGFEYGRDSYSSLPPANARKRVRFTIRMADGFAFSARVNGRLAQRLAKMLTGRCSVM